MALNPGEAAPDFTLPATDGETLSLADLKGKTVVLYFYPKDDTSGCTKEAQAFNGLRDAFSAQDAVIIGVSPDPIKSHEKFKTKYELGFPLVSRRGEGYAGRLWRLGRKEHVWSKVYGGWSVRPS